MVYVGLWRISKTLFIRRSRRLVYKHGPRLGYMEHKLRWPIFIVPVLLRGAIICTCRSALQCPS